jgi:hypothetical protein
MDRLSRDGLTGRRAKAFGGVVEVRSGKARIVVESCRGRFVAERMRHSADRGARLDGRRCGGVTKIVRSDVSGPGRRQPNRRRRGGNCGSDVAWRSQKDDI